MKQLKKILFYVDDQSGLVLLERAVQWAELHCATLTLAAVVKPATSQVVLSRGDVDLNELERLLVEDRKRQLDEAVKTIDNHGVSISTRVLVGDPVVSIVRAVLDDGFDFLAKPPAPAQGLRQQLFGSVDMRLMRACPCPMAIGRPRTREGGGHAVAALDYDENDERKSQLNQAILDGAVFALGASHSELHVVHAWSLYGETLLAGRGKLPAERLTEIREEERVKRQEWIERLIANYRNTLDETQAARFNPKVELLHGDPVVVIPRRTRELDADVLGLGTVSRTGLSGLLIGNTAEAILNRVDCTVVVHKPEGFVSPVAAT